jgi:hypothetical protein
MAPFNFFLLMDVWMIQIGIMSRLTSVHYPRHIVVDDAAKQIWQQHNIALYFNTLEKIYDEMVPKW